MVDKMKLREISLLLIDPPGVQARLEIEPQYIEELALSIDKIGLQQPIVVRPLGGRFEIVAGHRRYLATKSLDLKAISCIVRDVDDLQVAIARASENLVRVNLTPYEEAIIYKDLVEVNGMSFGDVARWMGKTAGTIKRRLELLSMPQILQEAVHKKLISVTVAEELWPVSDLDMLDYYLQIVIENGATRDVVRQWVHEWKRNKENPPGASGEGRPLLSPLSPRPYYTSCDTCMGPLEITKEHSLRVCDDCFGIIIAALKRG